MLTQGAAGTTGVVLLKYDRKAETEADLLGTQYLWKAGWDPEVQRTYGWAGLATAQASYWWLQARDALRA